MSDYVTRLADRAIKQIEAGEEIRAIILQHLPAIPDTPEDLAGRLETNDPLRLRLVLALDVDLDELVSHTLGRIRAGAGEDLKTIILQHLDEIPDTHILLLRQVVRISGLRMDLARVIWYTSGFLARQAFRKMEAGREIRKVLQIIPTSHDLAVQLESQPGRQAELALATKYTPSQWLLDQELRHIKQRRERHEIERIDFTGDTYRRASASGFMGLCFSGGGIRSATFNLGVLQGLAELKLLRCFDYLSSVSGGGYIHEWLAAWVKRESDKIEDLERKPAAFNLVQNRLIPLPEKDNLGTHPEQVTWLRRYSNYLTPQRGILTADTWVAAGTWLRNTILNQIILVTGLFFLVLLPHLFLYGSFVQDANLTAATSVGLFVLAAFFLGENLFLIDQRSQDGLAFDQALVQILIVLPLLVAAIGMVFLFPVLGSDLSYTGPYGAIALLFVIFAGIITFRGRALDSFAVHNEPLGAASRPGKLKRLGALIGLPAASVFAGLCGAAWTIFCGWLISFPGPLSGQTSARLAITIGPPLLLGGPLTTMLLLIGLLGRTFLDARREWLARFASWTGLYALAWTVFVGLSLFGFGIVEQLIMKTPAGISALVGWITTSGGAVMAGRSVKTAGVKADKQQSRFNPLEVLALVGPYIFIFGLLLLLSWMAEIALRGTQDRSDWVLIAIYVLPLLFCLLFAWRVDINEFSMHAFYRNRLVRCYLGASTPDRRPNPFTGFDKDDANVALKDLVPENGYYGPFPIFCTALNLTYGQDLAWQERKAASFAFTPLHSGYDVPWTSATGPTSRLRFNGFVETGRYAYPRAGIHISTAAAISGAALSPNWGYHTSPATAFLLTVFNVRLGWWLRNPRVLNGDGTKRESPRRRSRRRQDQAGSYPAASPRVALLRLISELLGRADDTNQYVYLTDGGHFDNMGLYELVRRRCRYIVICDAEDDGKLKFEGIGMAIRKCRIDFGVEINLDLRPLQHVAGTQYSKAHCVVGTVKYPEDSVHPGVVVYIKSSLTGDEPADVLNYKKQHAAFPHDTTLNQWFTESQFESYRRLGHHVAFATFEPASPHLNNCEKIDQRDRYFSNLRSIWCAPTPEMERYSAEHTKRYEALMRMIRLDPNLPGLFDMLFDPGDGLWEQGRTRAQIEHAERVSSELIEFMFAVYMELNLVLPENRNHPFSRGWYVVFGKWCQIDAVREGWLRYRSGYSRSFQLFAQTRPEILLPAD